MRLSQIISPLPFLDWDGLLQILLLVLEVLAAGMRDVEASATATIPNPEAELTYQKGLGRKIPKTRNTRVANLRSKVHDCTILHPVKSPPLFKRKTSGNIAIQHASRHFLSVLGKTNMFVLGKKHLNGNPLKPTQPLLMCSEQFGNGKIIPPPDQILRHRTSSSPSISATSISLNLPQLKACN